MAGLVNPIKSTSLYEISVDTANPCNYGDCRPFSVFFKTVYTKAKAKNKRKMARVSNLSSRRDYWQGLSVCTIACTLIPFTVLKPTIAVATAVFRISHCMHSYTVYGIETTADPVYSMCLLLHCMRPYTVYGIETRFFQPSALHQISITFTLIQLKNMITHIFLIM